MKDKKEKNSEPNTHRKTIVKTVIYGILALLCLVLLIMSFVNDCRVKTQSPSQNFSELSPITGNAVTSSSVNTIYHIPEQRVVELSQVDFYYFDVFTSYDDYYSYSFLVEFFDMTLFENNQEPFPMISTSVTFIIDSSLDDPFGVYFMGSFFTMLEFIEQFDNGSFAFWVSDQYFASELEAGFISKLTNVSYEPFILNGSSIPDVGYWQGQYGLSEWVEISERVPEGSAILSFPNKVDVSSAKKHLKYCTKEPFTSSYIQNRSDLNNEAECFYLPSSGPSVSSLYYYCWETAFILSSDWYSSGFNSLLVTDGNYHWAPYCFSLTAYYFDSYPRAIESPSGYYWSYEELQSSTGFKDKLSTIPDYLIIDMIPISDYNGDFNGWYSDGYADGEEKGFQDGYADGEEKGFQDGYAQGIQESSGSIEEESYNKGYSDGLNRGQSESITNPVTLALQAAHDFLDIRFFGTISLGSVFMVVLFVAVATIFIKMFAGG